MKPSQTRTDYRDRIDRVLVYIRDHLDGELNLDELSEVACLSRFHWHRVYREMIGETIWQSVHRLRLGRAAHDLVETNFPVSEIAIRAGYSSQRVFSRAFAKAYGLSPLHYRAQGGCSTMFDATRQSEGLMYKVKLETRDAARIAGFMHQGSYREINATFGKLTAEIATNGPFPHHAMGAVYFDDPDLVAEGQLTSLAGLALKEGVAVPAGMDHVDLPAGRYAVLVHKGPYSELHKAYSFLFGCWLNDSSVTLRPVPVAEIYLNTPVNTLPKDLLTEVLLAIE